MGHDEQVEAAWASRPAAATYGRKSELRVRLAGEQNWRCCYCGCRMDSAPERDGDPSAATLEFLVPRSRGGLRVEANAAVACSECNQARGDAIWQVHRRLMDEGLMPRID